MADSCALTCLYASSLNCKFPPLPFPICHVGESDRRMSTDGNRVYCHHARNNTVEYGTLSAVSWDTSSNGIIHFRNNGRESMVQYDTACIPILPPNSSSMYDYTCNITNQRIEHIVNQNFYYFKSNFYRTYVPIDTLISCLVHNAKLYQDIQSFEPCQGSVISYTSPWTEDTVIIGYLVFAGGPNLNDIYISVLTKPSHDGSCTHTEDRYIGYVNSQGYITFSYTECLRCPGQIRQVSSLQVQNKMLVGIRCDYHMIILEGPSPEKEVSLLETLAQSEAPYMGCPPMVLLSVLDVYSTSVLTSSIALSPYIFGEAVLVTESGGVYLWEYSHDDSAVVITIQSPIETFEVPHYWQCVFGPHPRYIILAEHSDVCSIEFIDNPPTYKTIIDQKGFYMTEDMLISCIANHPIHPFYLFIATGELLLLYDLRQHNEPMLEIRHELLHDIRLINVLCCQWEPTVTYLMVSSLNNAKTHVYCIEGGYTFNDTDPSPPYIQRSPHAVDTFTYFRDQINSKSPVITWRLSQQCVGACIVPLHTDNRFCGLTISRLGDVYMQVWHYETASQSHSLVRPHTPKECTMWLEDILDQARLLDQTHKASDRVSWDMSVIMDYAKSALADTGICVRCLSLINTGGPFQDVPLPPSLPLPKTILDSTSNVWECHLCHDNISTSRQFPKFHANDQINSNANPSDVVRNLLIPNELKDFSKENQDVQQVKDESKMTVSSSSNDQSCYGGHETISDYEELNRLWMKWSVNDTVTSSQEEGNPVSIKEEPEDIPADDIGIITDQLSQPLFDSQPFFGGELFGSQLNNSMDFQKVIKKEKRNTGF